VKNALTADGQPEAPSFAVSLHNTVVGDLYGSRTIHHRTSFNMSNSDDETYLVPSKDPRLFAGIKRKRINFVPAASASSAPATPTPSAQSVTDRYLSIVMSEANSKPTSEPVTTTQTPSVTPPRICEICHNPVIETLGPDGETIPHEASLAHQVKLQHSHPPSSVDRTRKGLAFLQAQGWDPDSRLGLGAAGEGRLHPIVVKEKNDRDGIGIERKEVKLVEAPKKVQKLNAKQSRKMDAEAKKRGELLRDMFFRDEAVDKYLGELRHEDIQRSKSRQDSTKKRI
jgi:hypothetical protein